ncbi:MAG: DNA polymerase II [Pseudomonadota bacterium]
MDISLDSVTNSIHTFEGELAGVLLSRQWRDTADGLQLRFWYATPKGTAQITVSGERAVCFVPRSFAGSTGAATERRPLGLLAMTGEAVDGLYFRAQRDLQNWLNGSPMHPQLAFEADIKPSDRFLMERFVTLGLAATGHWRFEGGFWRIDNAKVAPADAEVPLRLASLDIETGGGRDAPLYSIGVALDSSSTVFMVGGPVGAVREDDIQVEFCGDEAQTLRRFFSWWREADPDGIVGWNLVDFDLAFLHRKCEALGVDFAFGRGGEPATVLAPSRSDQPRVARIPGRVVLDGVDLLRAAFWQFESFALDNVAYELLGERKLISTSGLDKLEEIQRQYREAPLELARYNARDCELVLKIFDKADLLAFALERARLTGLAVDRLGGSSAAFDNLYLPRLHRRGRVALSLAQVNQGTNSPGGYVMDSIPGLYKNVLVLDFKSLYPSIIRTFSIDPLALVEPGDDPVPGYRGAEFGRDRPILPALIADLWSARDDAKAARNAPLSQAIKIIMNSFYGVLGSSGCRFHDERLASSITLRGHDIITRSQAWIEAEGDRVIYGDTDSLFVWLGNDMAEDVATRRGAELAAGLNRWWRETLLSEMQVESQLEIEFETHYVHFLMPTLRGSAGGSKKRYAGVVRDSDGMESLVFKGLEAARTDWTPLARNFQRELYRRVFAGEPVEEYCQGVVSVLYSGASDDQLTYRKRLRRKVDDYQKNIPPHVQAAKRLRRPGRWIEYRMTVDGPEPIELAQAPIDYDHYRERQLAPAADGILHFLGTSLGDICDEQMRLF